MAALVRVLVSVEGQWAAASVGIAALSLGRAEIYTNICRQRQLSLSVRMYRKSAYAGLVLVKGEASFGNPFYLFYLYPKGGRGNRSPPFTFQMGGRVNNPMPL